MLAPLQHQTSAASWMAGRGTMAGDANDEHDRARRFRDAALPHLDDVNTLARYFMRNPADAEDAVQECYLRALRPLTLDAPSGAARAVPIRPAGSPGPVSSTASVSGPEHELISAPNAPRA
jgi:hypothetical protein